MKRTKREDKEEKMCKCGRNPAEEPHTCPYSEEIGGNSETLCTCCEDCRHECAMDI